MKTMRAIFLAAMLVVTACAGGRAAKVVLAEETGIMVKFDSTMVVNSGKLQPGINLEIYLARDVTIGGMTVVEAGARGTARVVEAREAARPGKPGFIKIGFVELEPKGEFKTQGGEKIKLAGVVENTGKGRKALSWIFVLGLFIKGGQGEIDVAREYPAAIKETIVLEN